MNGERMNEIMELYEMQDKDDDLGLLDSIICAESSCCDSRTTEKLVYYGGNMISRRMSQGDCCC